MSKDFSDSIPENPTTDYGNSGHTTADAIPPLIHKRYRIDKELGRGGIGVVYLARDIQLHNRPVVIKVLQESNREEWITKKFRQEIEALARIGHPGIVEIYDAGEMPDGRLYIVMQFVPGQNLRTAMREQPQMEFRRAAQIVDQIGRALTAAHEKGVFHCDLKPENIMLQSLDQGEEVVRLIDFGIAKIRDSMVPSSEPTRLAGTLDYMAPEQLENKFAASNDIFAFGLIACEMLTGQKVFNKLSLLELVQRHQQGIQIGPKILRPELSDAADAAVMKALARKPEERYQRARDFSTELSRALVSESIANSPFGSSMDPHQKELRTPERGQSPEQPLTNRSVATLSIPKKSRLVVTLIGLVLLSLAAAAIIWEFGGKTSQQKSPAPSTAAPIVKQLPPVPAAATPQLQFSYSLLVQKVRDGAAYGEPFQLAREILFEKDYKIRLQIKGHQSGFFYLMNEGPVQGSAGTPQYVLLFPSALTQGGSASLEPSQKIEIPEKSWFTFDEEQGTEKLWMFFSLNPVAELEAVRVYANEKDMGEVKDPAKAKHIQELIAKNTSKAPELAKDSHAIETKVRQTGDLLVNLVLLEHH